MRKLFGGFITITLVSLAVLTLYVAIVWRFDLITVKPAFGYVTFGLIVLVGSGLLKAYRQYEWLVGWLATAGAILFLLGMVKANFPHTSESVAHAQTVADADGAAAIDEKVGPTPVRCDRDAHPDRFWNPSTGTAVVFSLATEAGRIECANRAGFHSISRQRYLPVTEAVVRAILAQPPPTPPTTVCNQPTPAPIPSPTLPATAPEEKLIPIVTR